MDSEHLNLDDDPKDDSRSRLSSSNANFEEERKSLLKHSADNEDNNVPHQSSSPDDSSNQILETSSGEHIRTNSTELIHNALGEFGEKENKEDSKNCSSSHGDAADASERTTESMEERKMDELLSTPSLESVIDESTKELQCYAVVVRAGERFAELAIEFEGNLDVQSRITNWQLFMYEIDFSLENQKPLETSEENNTDLFTPPKTSTTDSSASPNVVFNNVMDIKKNTKIVKLSAGKHYRCGVRFCVGSNKWSAWSPAIITATFHSVAVHLSEIGEDSAKLDWGRVAERDTRQCAPERDTLSTKAIEDIPNFEVRVVRERDGVKEFNQVFDSSVRFITVHNLIPSTAYVVEMRYESLLHTYFNWVEVARFYTETSMVMELLSRGEDKFSVSWHRGELPRNSVGYRLPKTEIELYELHIDDETHLSTPIQISAKENKYNALNLFPGGSYSVYLRCLTKDGRWGGRSNVLEIQTAYAPKIELIHSGETFLCFRWFRRIDEPGETQIQYDIQEMCGGFKAGMRQNESVPIQPERKILNVDNLKPSTSYSVSFRTFLDNEWGLWTESEVFTTSNRSVLTLLERGEDFLTFSCTSSRTEIAATSKKSAITSTLDPFKPKYNIVVTKLGKQYAGKENKVVVLDEVTEMDETNPGFRVGSLEADCLYEATCRILQHNEVTGANSWGAFSAPMAVRTLQSVSVSVMDLGEDFVRIVWRRGLEDETIKDSSNKNGTQKSPGQQNTLEDNWRTIKYEIVLGCMDTSEDDILHRQVVDTNYTINNLRPATTYIISVRAFNEKEQWGLWSKIKVRTLPSMRTAIHEIGEDYVRLTWEREILPDESADTITAENYVSQYSVFVFSKFDSESDNVADKNSGYYRGGRAEVSKHMLVSSDHSSLLISDLLPNRTYEAVVQAATGTGKWGLWSAPIFFRTNAQAKILVERIAIGENYANIEWEREAAAVTNGAVHTGDLSITGQQLRIRAAQSSFSKEFELKPEVRNLKLDGLSPASAYSICVRVCGKSGLWGLWSEPIHILTRGTILTKTVEVAENYAIVAWERAKVPNPHRYPTGRGGVTTYHLRVSNVNGVHLETFLGDGDCPFRISNLKPDTYYCVELKANYNDEEWGLWSAPMWCLTLPCMRIKAQLISEEFCRLSITRIQQQHRLPEDDGNKASEDKIVSFGQLRPHLILCVTAPILTRTPHSAAGTTTGKHLNSALPPEAADHRLIYQTEIISSNAETEHVVPNLKSNTVYSVSVRSKLPNGDWGMWAPPLLFATVPTTCLVYNDIGENFIKVEWKRNSQSIPPQVSGSVVQGLGTISASRVRVREIGGSFQHTYLVENSMRTMRLENLLPATTYAISVQTYNDNFNWGVWSEESFARTVPGLNIDIQHVSEDAIWVAWARKTDVQDLPDTNTALNVSTSTKSYEVCLSGAGNFRYARELETESLFFRGLQPDTIYSIHVRVQFVETEEWGLWSTKSFRTKPRLRVTFGNIGEHFAVLEWRRHLPKVIDEQQMKEFPGRLVDTPDVVLQYRFKVLRVGDDVAKIYNLNPNLSSFNLKGLEPSSEFRVWVCAAGYEGVWGCWSEESRVRTIPKLRLDVADIGEDYVRVKWYRQPWSGEHMEESDEVEVRQVDGAVSGYQVRVLDMKGEIVATQNVSFRETTCVLSGLKLRSVYSVEVAAKDTYNQWGLWSDSKRFLTLQAVRTRLLRIGESFVDVEWLRCGNENAESRKQSVSRRSKYTASDVYENSDEEERIDIENLPEDVIREDDTVSKWHVRVRSPEGEDVAEFYCEPGESWKRIEDLTPNKSHKISVRAMNKGKEWGHWSPPLDVETYPLLEMQLEAKGETFLQVSWKRATWTLREEQRYQRDFIVFPDISDAHNYYVNIKPLPGETPFDPIDEPLPDGSRGYETTQPSIRLGNLKPGTHYQLTVCEQMIDDDEELMPSTFGRESTVVNYQTISAIHVHPIEIGEDYSLVEWGRILDSTHSAIGGKFSPAKGPSEEFEVRVRRLRDDARGSFEGSLALDVVHTLTSVNQLLIESLHPSAIYEVRVRAKGEGDMWGPWCQSTKFITQSRLQLTVDSVLETNVIVSWSRPLPSWATGRIKKGSDDFQLGKTNAAEPIIGISSQNTTDVPLDVNDDYCAEGSTDVNADPFAGVLLPNNTIQDYELHVEGISCSYNESFTYYKERTSAKISKLLHNTLYSISVRSLSEKQHWSVFSNKETVLTMCSLTLSAKYVTENVAVLRWARPVSNLDAFNEVLKENEMKILEMCSAREKKELFELKRRLQDEDLDDQDWNDQEGRALQNAALRQEATRHLKAESVHLGDESVTSAYNFRLYSECKTCIPTIDHHYDIVLESEGATNQLKKSDRRKAGKKGVDNFDQTLNGTVNTLVLQSSYVLELSLKAHVGEIVVRNLPPVTEMSFEICARLRHVEGEEWQSWSERFPFKTLQPYCLFENLFADNFVDLFWLRGVEDNELFYHLASTERKLKEVRSLLKGTTFQNIEEKKDALTEEEYTNYRVLLDELTTLGSSAAQQKQELLNLLQDQGDDANGDDAPFVTEKRAVAEGFLLRVVEENGNFTDTYLTNIENLYKKTIDRLESNTLYSFLMCPDYGSGLWGYWTNAVKVLMPHTLQIYITFAAENYIDLEWRRLANKRIPIIDRPDTTTLEQQPLQDTTYAIRLTVLDPKEGTTVENIIEVQGQTSYRIENLGSDCMCTVSIRMLSLKGEWGPWSNVKSCITLPRMGITATKIDESSALLSWNREEAAKDYNEDIHVLQFQSKVHSYYVKVQEVRREGQQNFTASNGLAIPAVVAEVKANDEGQSEALNSGENANSNHSTSSDNRDNKKENISQSERKSTIYDNISSLNDKKQEKAEAESETQFDKAPTGAMNSTEFHELKDSISEDDVNNSSNVEPEEFEGMDANGCFLLIKRFDGHEHNFKIKNLQEDTMYKVQVLALTENVSDRVWSPQRFFRTLSKERVDVIEVSENFVDIRWWRDDNQTFAADVYVSDYVPVSYDVVISSVEDTAFHVERNFNASVSECRIRELTLSTLYSVRVRPKNVEGSGVWSEPMQFQTLTPFVIEPLVLTEDRAVVRWARPSMQEVGAVRVERQDDELSKFGSHRRYHVRVYETHEDKEKVLLKEEYVQAPRTHHIIEGLLPGGSYNVAVRGEVEDNVWGTWSDETKLTTRNLLQIRLATIGEHYVRLTWADVNKIRGSEPDEAVSLKLASVSYYNLFCSTDKSTLDGAKEYTISGENTEYCIRDLDESTTYYITIQPMYDLSAYQAPFLCGETSKSNEVTTSGSSVASSGEYNEIRKYSSGRVEDDLEKTNIYHKKNEKAVSGVYSETYTVRTMTSLEVWLEDIGEDSCNVYWEPAHVDSTEEDENSRETKATEGQKTLYYELSLFNRATNVSNKNNKANEKSDYTTRENQEDTSSEQCKLLKSEQKEMSYFLKSDERTLLLQNLMADSNYALRMRYWFTSYLNDGDRDANGAVEGYMKKYVEGKGQHFTAELVSGEDGPHRRLEQLGAIASEWTEVLNFNTLKDVICIVRSIREDGIIVEWERETLSPSAKLSSRKTSVESTTTNVVHHIRLHVEEIAPDGSSVPQELSAHEIDRELKLNQTEYSLQKLRPDTLYTVKIAYFSSKGWGQWSPVVWVRTLPPLMLLMNGIFENCATISWKRAPARRLVIPPEAVHVLGTESPTLVDRYQIDIRAVDGEYQLSKRLKGTRTSYQVRSLDAASLYRVQIRANDGFHTEFGAWCEPVFFATLKPLRITVSRLAEFGAQLSWWRPAQKSEEYTQSSLGLPVSLGDPAALAAYHLCVFEENAMPTEAVFDKQVEPGCSSCIVRGLRPSTNYITIIRACSDIGEFGWWSEELSFETMGSIALSQIYLGEDCVIVKIEGKSIENPLFARPQNFTLLLKTPSGEVYEKPLTLEECKIENDGQFSFRMDGLAPGTEYFAVVQPFYGDLFGWGEYSPVLTCMTLSTLGLTVTPEQNNLKLQFGRPTFRTVAFADSSADTKAAAAVNSCPAVLRYDVRVCYGKDRERAFSIGPSGGGRPSAGNKPIGGANAASVSGAEMTHSALTKKEKRAICLFSKVFEADDVYSTKEIKYSIKDLEMDTCYSVGVRSMDATGVWGDWALRTVYTPPLPPSNVKLHRLNAHYCSLQWKPNGTRGTYRYFVEYSSTGTDSGVIATSAGGGSSLGARNGSSPITSSTAYPPTSTNLTSSSSTPGTSSRKNAANVEWHEIDQVEENVCGIRLQGPASRLRCRVKCIRTENLTSAAADNSFSEYSQTVSVTEGTPPEEVKNVQVISLSRNTATIEWTSTHTAVKTSFVVFLASKGSNFVEVSTEHHCVVVLKDLNPSTEYLAQIVAQNSSGISFNNPIIRFVTKVESDITTTYFEEGMAPLGNVVEPHEFTKEPNARMIPSPPSKGSKLSTRTSRFSGTHSRPESGNSSFLTKLEDTGDSKKGSRTLPVARGAHSVSKPSRSGASRSVSRPSTAHNTSSRYSKAGY